MVAPGTKRGSGRARNGDYHQFVPANRILRGTKVAKWVTLGDAAGAKGVDGSRASETKGAEAGVKREGQGFEEAVEEKECSRLLEAAGSVVTLS